MVIFSVTDVIVYISSFHKYSMPRRRLQHLVVVLILKDKWLRIASNDLFKYCTGQIILLETRWRKIQNRRYFTLAFALVANV